MIWEYTFQSTVILKYFIISPDKKNILLNNHSTLPNLGNLARIYYYLVQI